MKRGLFVCYDPHALMQFLQFYCMNDFPAEWDVLCLPVENGEEYMHSYCEKTEIFKNIFTGNVEYMNLPILKKLGLFLYMFFFAIIGLRKKCCKNILNKYVKNVDQYDILCSNVDTGFISGMLASFGNEKVVIYFEDGASDYIVNRSRWKTSIVPFFSLMNLQCVVMARLGYFAKGFLYFTPTKNCLKYVSNKNELKYKLFKEIKEFNLDYKSKQIYEKFLINIYPELRATNISKDAVVFFTTPLSDYSKNFEKYASKITNYLSQKFSFVYLKKHPRDYYNYQFPNEIKVTSLNNKIPAELYFPFLKDNICCFDEISSVIIGLKNYVSKVIVLHIKDLNNIQEYFTISEKKLYLDKFLPEKYQIIEI